MFARLARALGGPVRELVGRDRFGNTYFVVRKATSSDVIRGVSWHDLRKKEERHVEWADGGSRCGNYAPELLPVEWSSWLNFRRPDPPLTELPTTSQPEQLEAAHDLAVRFARVEQLAGPETPVASPLASPVASPASATQETANGGVQALKHNSAVDALRDGYKPEGWASGTLDGQARQRRRGGAANSKDSLGPADQASTGIASPGGSS